MQDEQFEAFFSYTHHDDQTDGGYLTRMCNRLAQEVRSHTGRSFPIFIDHSDIHPSQPWKERIEHALDTCKVFIPIITPNYLTSDPCREEFERFLRREAALGRNDLILPIYYIACPEMKQAHPVSTIIQQVRARQYVDWTDLRGKRFTVSAARTELERLAQRIRDILGSFPGGEMPPNAGATVQTMTADQPGVPLDLSLLPEPPSFVGREDELAWVIERLRAGGTIGITALRGMGGIGKTALAAVAVHRLRADGRFKDGIAVLLCAGKSDATSVLQEVLARFTGGKTADAQTEAELAAAARRVLHGKDALIALDNVEPELEIAKVATPLKEAGATLLLTARHALPTAVVPLNSSRKLDLLAVDEALGLFAESYGFDDFQAFSPADAAAVRRIVTALARHTLAVKLAAINAAEEERSLPALAAELEADPRRALGLPHDDVDAALALAFEESTKRLPREAIHLFAALAAFATPEFGRNAALFVGKSLGLGQPEPILRVLLRRALVDAAVAAALPEEGSDRERLRIHPLVKVHATGLLARNDRETASRAVAAYYASYANATADSALGPDEENITGALEWAHAHDEDALLVRLVSGMQYYWRDRSRTRESLRYLPWAIPAAEMIASTTHDRGDRLRAAGLAVMYGDTLSLLGRLNEAENAFRVNLQLARELADRTGEGRVLSRLGQLAQARGRLDEAEGYLRQSLLIRREVQDRRGEGVVLSTLGQLAQARGRYEDAEQLYRQGLDVLREVQDAANYAGVAMALGALLITQRGQHQEGCVYFAQAIEMYHAMGVPDEEQARETARRLGCDVE